MNDAPRERGWLAELAGQPGLLVSLGYVLASLIGLVMDRVAQRERRWLERRQPNSRPCRAYLGFSRWATGHRGFVPLLFFVSYAAGFIWVYAERAADRIRAGEGERVVVTRAEGGTVLEGVLVEAIGSVRPSPRSAEKSRPALAGAEPAASPAASAETGKNP